MTDDLVKRLREIQGQAGLFASAAADRIEALERELSSGSFYKETDIDALMARAEAAEAKLAEAVKMLDDKDREYNRKTNDMINRHAATVAALTAQVKAMQGALDEIANQETTHAADRCTCTPTQMLNEVRAIARAALTTENPNG